MKQLTAARQSAIQCRPVSAERRRIVRTPIAFGLMYSGISQHGVLIGDGTVVNLSKDGLGIRGNQPVTVGLELTMFLYLPDGNDPLFVLEAIVAWCAGNLFGVEFQKLNLRERKRLQAFLRARSSLRSWPVSH